MKLHSVSISAINLLGIAFATSAAHANSLWRGIGVITARSSTTNCIAEYDIGDNGIVEYRPLAGGATDETIIVMREHGALVIKSKSTDADKTLRTGGVDIFGGEYASAFVTSVASQPITIKPNPVTASTATIVMSGTIKDFGIIGCNVTFSASLLPVFDGPK